MSKVITFSRTFPAYHSRKGQPTYFIEKINKALGFEYGIPFGEETEKHFADQGVAYSHNVYSICPPKYHTIRSGNRFKVGEKFSPRVWSGKPYASKQVIIAPDIQIKKIFEFEVTKSDYILQGKKLNLPELEKLAKNDGLTSIQLEDWFPKLFVGQVICWNENVNY